MIYKAVQKLIDYALKNELITEYDIYVVRNQLMDALNLTDWKETDAEYSNETIDEILKQLIGYACENNIIADTSNSRDLFDTKLMGILTPMPREVVTEFNKRYAVNPKEATDWYFDFSKKLNYVRAGRIEKDLKWTYDCEYGTLDITINCSKPEKDPRDIAAAKTQKSSVYPKCQLCPENAGFAGHASHPARQNLRPVPIKVNNEKWQLQYSPYGYYNEHCIFFNEKHIPMKIDNTVFEKLFDIVDFLPHYTVGSNADLPIVGGSILTHEHFQGGNYSFAMEKAPIETEFEIRTFPDVKAGIVKWPVSVIRVASPNRKQLSECCAEILEKWRNYSDENAGIYAFTDNTPHNTITPIARKKNDTYESDLVLRNNITTSERPMGVFHPNPSLHHIKKENIGLIEVMGLAVLPSRLAKEIALLKDAMLSGENLYSIPELTQHADWANKILAEYPHFNKTNAETILKQEIGKVFLEVLEDAGVFKRNDGGKKAFEKFIDFLQYR
ncbi:MAG: UDP-glucose--hexose-1-phosphate uridylyltransferase [Oscillospiraceae bacterium]|nr:UDP-glucose--hexose-1-phosphate uridylyltransferase [Oscillospiraceae bacterium]